MSAPCVIDPEPQAAVDPPRQGGADLHGKVVTAKEVGGQDVVEHGPLSRLQRPLVALVATRHGHRLESRKVALAQPTGQSTRLLLGGLGRAEQS